MNLEDVKAQGLKYKNRRRIGRGSGSGHGAAGNQPGGALRAKRRGLRLPGHIGDTIHHCGPGLGPGLLNRYAAPSARGRKRKTKLRSTQG